MGNQSQEDWRPAFMILGCFRALLEDFCILALRSGGRGHWGWYGVPGSLTSEGLEH